MSLEGDSTDGIGDVDFHRSSHTCLHVVHVRVLQYASRHMAGPMEWNNLDDSLRLEPRHD